MTAFVSELPVAAPQSRLGLPEREAGNLVETLRRLGIRTLGELARLSPSHVAGEDELLVPSVHGAWDELAEEIELPEGTAGSQLERALELLVDRLLAAPERKGRTLLGLRLGALLGDGGSWSVAQGLGRPTSSARALRAVLLPRLEQLPAPAVSLSLRAVGLGARAAEQIELSLRGDESRRHRLTAALREVRAAQGADSLLKVLPVDGASRIPERRALLTPYPALGR